MPQVYEFDCATGIGSQRDMTPEEVARYEADAAVAAAREAEIILKQESEEAARESARAKLAALGLTEAEVAALVK